MTLREIIESRWDGSVIVPREVWVKAGLQTKFLGNGLFVLLRAKK